MLDPNGVEIRNGMVPIPEASNVPFYPQEIVFAKITFDADHDATRPDKLTLVFDAKPNTQVYDPTDVDAFAKLVATGHRPTGTPKTPPSYTRTSKLDLYPDRQCWVVIQLDPDRNWQFCVGDYAITTKEPHPDDNAYLRHYDKDGNRFPGALVGDEGCRVAAFQLIRRKAHVPQQFNLHVEILENGYKSLVLILDPAIPNDGSGIP